MSAHASVAVSAQAALTDGGFGLSWMDIRTKCLCECVLTLTGLALVAVAASWLGCFSEAGWA